MSAAQTRPWCYECGPLTVTGTGQRAAVPAAWLWGKYAVCPTCQGPTDGIPHGAGADSLFDA